jgi:hypothetical protein
MVPWTTDLMRRNIDLLGAEWWPYGIARNRAALEAILRYHYEQGLTSRQFSVDEIFAVNLLDT